MVGDTPTIEAITRFIYKNWCHLQKPDFYLHEVGYFILNFGSVEDRDEVLYSGPHTFQGL